MVTPTALSKLGGWIDDKEQVQAVVRGLPIPVFQSQNPEAITDKEDVLLYEAVRSVTGKDLPAQAQGIGDCVSWGWKHAVDYHQCVMIQGGHLAEFKPTATEVIYALSRVEVGGGRLGRGDGSIGAWAAKAVSQYGILSKGKHGRFDLTDYDKNKAKKWGYKGLPDSLEPVAKDHLVKTVSLVRTYEEAKVAIKSGYPVPVCSNRGFTLTRDKNGFCHPKGSWGHCMCFVGVIESDGKPSLVCINSWGPNSPRGPRSDWKLPVNGFRVAADVADKMLRVGDSFSVSGFDGYPPLTLDWSVVA